jgi:hypothetical protein
MAEYDVIIGARPDDPSDVQLSEMTQANLLQMVGRLRNTLGIDDDGHVPDGTLEDLVDYLHERWDGETGEEDAEG